MRTEDADVQAIWAQPNNTLPYEAPDQKKRIARMVESLQKHGQREPICVSESLEIRDGHTRWLAAKKLGWKTIKATIMSDDEWRALRLHIRRN